MEAVDTANRHFGFRNKSRIKDRGLSMKKKRGRPPLFGTAMTPTQIKQRYRQKKYDRQYAEALADTDDLAKVEAEAGSEARIAAEAIIGSAASWKQKFDAARLKGATETTIKEDAENVIDETRKRHKGNIGLDVLSEMINVVREAAAV
jgi:hypothetical protein